VVKKALNLQDNMVNLEEQQKNIFYVKYYVHNRGFGDVYPSWNNDEVL